MTGEMRYIADHAEVDPDGLLQLASGKRPRSYLTLEALERGLVDIPMAVVYDKVEDRHTLYVNAVASREVPWDWGKWPPHVRIN